MPIDAPVSLKANPDEGEAVFELKASIQWDKDREAKAQQHGALLTQAMTQGAKETLTQRLLAAFPLTSPEGLALMRMTEALLRIPDTASAAQLLCDELATAQWVPRSHEPMAALAALGMRAAKRVLRSASGAPRAGLSNLAVAIARRGVHRFGGQFVYAQTIEAALQKARANQDPLIAYSFDMLGEQALNAADVQRFEAAYANAIAALGPQKKTGRDVQVSIKLSALHPRYEALQRERVLSGLVPRVDALIQRARAFDLPVCIDAEEADRLELSLAVFSALSSRVKGWNGLGLAVQAYQLRAPQVIEKVVELARRDQRRIPVRLVKGAYWDSEIKHAQAEGLAGYPVFTRKENTDLSYLACAAQMLRARAQIAPAFATHNAYTFAAILQLAEQYSAGRDYEFQCLHGMGEPLIKAARVSGALQVPVRIYAPVGAFDALLPYLVRRLLENGANTSFIANLDASNTPVMVSKPLPLPRDLFRGRDNSRGVDWGSSDEINAFLKAPDNSASTDIQPLGYGESRTYIVGKQHDTNHSIAVFIHNPEQVNAHLARVETGAASWAARTAQARADCVRAWGDAMEREMSSLAATIVHEAGKTWPNAVSDVREAIDFCRYYALLAMSAKGTPLGVVATISPWNFPLAIFTGQVAASLAAGNAVIAKPAEQTPRIAQQAVALSYAAGIPQDALQLALGDGKVGAQLVADDRVRGVMFTGSLQVAKLIERTLHLRSGTQEIPFIAETSGLNAMIVDSTALIDQAVTDVVASAFDSAGQRCSALRLLWLQDDIADRFIAALKGAMAELRMGDPSQLVTDIGPVIDAEAHARLQAQVARLDREAKLVARVAMPEHTHFNTTLPYFAPCAYEIKDLQPVQEETFGPILHIRRFKASEVAQVLRDTAALGYALTFGLHTRLASRIATLAREAPAGNVYVNRNMIGAVVGSQPFGGGKKSGTGHKAGGPWALRRLQHGGEADVGIEQMPLPGITGERNTWSIQPRGLVACAGPTAADVKDQLEDIAQFGLGGIDASQDKSVLKRSDIGAVLCTQWNATYSADVASVREDILPIVAKSSTGYDITRLYEERVVSNNVAAAGGDVALLTQ